MPGSKTMARSLQQMQPIWSTSKAEAHRRVIKLYKTWYRQIPHIVQDYNLPYTTSQCRAKLHEEFLKQKYLTDIRQIDTLAIRKQLELKEISFMETERSQLLNYWKNDEGQTPQFLTKFLVGQN